MAQEPANVDSLSDVIYPLFPYAVAAILIVGVVVMLTKHLAYVIKSELKGKDHYYLLDAQRKLDLARDYENKILAQRDRISELMRELDSYKHAARALHNLYEKKKSS